MSRMLLLMLALCSACARAEDIAGKNLYMKTCSACHQADGMGVPDAFPALVGNTLVQGEAKVLIAVPLLGRGGMPNFSKRLDDASLAAILNYVRTAWGNTGSAIGAQDVAALRADLHADNLDSTPINSQH